MYFLDRKMNEKKVPQLTPSYAFIYPCSREDQVSASTNREASQDVGHLKGTGRPGTLEEVLLPWVSVFFLKQLTNPQGLGG